MSTLRSVSPRARGFTLVELLVVVFILGILASMAAISSGATSTQNLDLAEIQVRDAIERARVLAISRRMGHGVAFDLVNDRFAVVDEDGVAAIEPLSKRDYIVDFVRPNQPKLVELDAADFGVAGAAVLFDPQGVPLTGGTLTLRHKSTTRTLTLDEATGKISSS